MNACRLIHQVILSVNICLGIRKNLSIFFFVIMRIAAECLSICAGNPSIRQAILEVEQHIMFVWLLQSEDYDIRVNGALALAKFAAIDKVRFVKSQSFF